MHYAHRQYWLVLVAILVSGVIAFPVVASAKGSGTKQSGNAAGSRADMKTGVYNITKKAIASAPNGNIRVKPTKHNVKNVSMKGHS